MATYERAKLVRAVLIELGTLDATAAPEAAHSTLVGDACQQVLEGLYDEGLIPFDLAGNIPAAFFRPLVRVLAGELVVTYGKVARLTALKLNAREGRSSLCKLRDEGDDGLPARAVYY